jgi:ATP-dependent Lon protease
MSIFEFSDIVDESNAEFIPLLSAEDEDKFNAEKFPETLSILPLRNTVLFPGVVLPITVGRDKSIKLINDANNSDKIIGVISQKDQKIEDPAAGQLNRIGTIAKILKLLKMPDGSTTVIIQGKRKFELLELTDIDPYFKGKIKEIKDTIASKTDKQFEAAIISIKDFAKKIIKISPEIPSEANVAINNIESASFLMNFISSNMNVSVQEKQLMLEQSEVMDRATLTLKNLTKELQMLEMKNEIQTKVKTDIDQQQREFFLNQQMKQIQEELGGNPAEQELEELKKRAKDKKWNDEVKTAFNKELDKLQRMNPSGVEYSVQLNYAQVLLDLPWDEYSKDNFDINRSKKILDRDHYGLEKVKERVLEHLAVLKLKGDMKAPIICLDGPPGVGKTSLGKSIAEALNRKYVRASLGGLRDEAEIRGHRKTYIGAMPGRIIQNLKKAKTSNPVFILDEIDKVGASHQGDPSSALLEVLDPEQNGSFYDNFVEIDYDLSKVLFIATSNNIGNVHPALRDRMEVINVSGYTVEEKIEIAKKHLIPKQIIEQGLMPAQLKLNKKQIEKVIVEYTRESGVRTLEKKIASIARKIAKKVAMDEPFEPKISEQNIVEFLGPGISSEKYVNNEVAGVVTGLAWTSVGGDILFIESSLTKGKGKLTLTGNLGDVMKESAIIALEYLKSHSNIIGLEQDLFDRVNVHIHVPEGATPKDGPSAGITMLTSLASVFTQRKVKANLAMTGEITLRGLVLPVGGIKEKILAAKRSNIKEIIISEQNEKDINEIEPKYIKGLKFHYVKRMEDVLKLALTNQKVSNPITFE